MNPPTQSKRRAGCGAYLAANFVILLGAGFVSWRVSSSDQWEPLWFLIVLTLIATFLPLLGARIPGSQRLDAVGLVLVVAAVFLGPAPAAALGAWSMLVWGLVGKPLVTRWADDEEEDDNEQQVEEAAAGDSPGFQKQAEVDGVKHQTARGHPSRFRRVREWLAAPHWVKTSPRLRTRLLEKLKTPQRVKAVVESWQDGADLLVNLADFVIFPLAAGLVFQALAGRPTPADSQGALFYLHFGAAYLTMVGLGSLLHGMACWFLDSRSVKEIFREDIRSLLEPHVATVVLAVIVADLYLQLGGLGVAIWLAALVMYQRTLILGVRHERAEARSKQAHLKTVHSLATALDERDGTTGAHADRSVRMARRLYEAALLMEEESGGESHRAWPHRWIRHINRWLRRSKGEPAEGVVNGFQLHDVGKIGIPDAILNKRGPLSEADWDRMHEHPEIGLKIVEGLEDMLGQQGLAVIHYHHERFDGGARGYPGHLEGKEIPLSARVFALADAYDAMRNDRPYRNALSRAEALAEIEANAGSQFDPELVKLFIDLLNAGLLEDDVTTSETPRDAPAVAQADHNGAQSPAGQQQEALAAIRSFMEAKNGAGTKNEQPNGQPNSAERLLASLRSVVLKIVPVARTKTVQQNTRAKAVPVASVESQEPK